MAVAAKAQQEPQACWSLTGEMAPFSLQSTDSGNWLDLTEEVFLVEVVATVGVFLYPPMCMASNSASVKSLNWVTA